MVVRDDAEAKIDVRINDAAAVVGLRAIGSQLNALAVSGTRPLAALAAGSLAFVTAINQAAAAVAVLSLRQLALADDIDKMASRLGTSAGFIDQMHFAAKRSGGSVADLNTALTALSRRAAAQPALFDKWGISIRDANGQLKGTRDLLRAVADRIQNAESQAARLAIAQDVMSEAGRKLVPMLQNGAAGLEAFEAQASSLNTVITELERASAARLADRLGVLQEQGNALARTFGAVLEPIIEGIGIELSKVASATRDWMIANRDLIQSNIVDHLRFLGTTVLPILAGGVIVLGKGWHSFMATVNASLTVISAFFFTLAEGTATSIKLLRLMSEQIGPKGMTEVISFAEKRVQGLSDTLKKGMVDAAGSTKDSVSAFFSLDETVMEVTNRISRGLKRAAQGVKDFKASISAPSFGPGGKGEEGPAGPEVPELIDLGPIINVDAIDLKLMQAELRFQEFLQNLRQIGEQIGQVMLATFSASFANAIESIVNGSKGPLDALRGMVGETLMMLGRLVIQAGVAATLLGPLGILPGFQAYAPGIPLGLAAIAGGTALVALGSAIKGGSDAGTTASVGGGGGSSAIASRRVARPEDFSRGDISQGVNQTIVNNYSFRGTVVNPRRVARQLADASNGAVRGAAVELGS